MAGRRFVAGLSVVALFCAIVPTIFSVNPASAATAPISAPAAPAPALPKQVILASVQAEGLGALVDWFPNPASDKVTSYRVVPTVASQYSGPVPSGCATPSSISVTSDNTSALISGLCAQIPYTFTVQAINSAGGGQQSAPSLPATALNAQPPSAPLISSVDSRPGALLVNYDPPAIDGGDSLSGYTLKISGGQQPETVTISATAATGSYTVTGLTNNLNYSLSLTASSAAGTSAPATSTGIPLAQVPPQPPGNFVVAPNGKGSLVTTWSAPTDMGSTPLTKYVLTYQQVLPNSTNLRFGEVVGGAGTLHTVSLPPNTTTYTATGLAAGTYYDFSIVAVGAGNSTAVTTNNPVTPSIVRAPGTIELTQTTMNELISMTATSMSWPSPPPAQIQGLVPGNILVGPSSAATLGGSVLVEVLGSRTVGGQTVVSVGPASLTQAFRTLTVSVSGGASSVSGASLKPTVPGVRQLLPAQKSQAGDPCAVLNTSFNDSSISGGINGTFCFDFAPDVSLSVTQGSLTVGGQITASANFTTTLTGSLNNYQIADPTLFSIPIIPPFINGTIQAGILLTADGTVTILTNASLNAGGYATCTLSNGCSGTNTSGNPPVAVSAQLVPGAASQATGTVGLGVEPQICLSVTILIAGANGCLNAEVMLDLTATINFAGPVGSPEWTLQPCLTISAGVNASFWVNVGFYSNSYNPNAEVNILSNYCLGYIDGPPISYTSMNLSPNDPEIPPGGSQQFAASDGQTNPLTWYLVGATGQDTISTGGLLTIPTNGTPVGGTLAVGVIDLSTGAAATTTVTVGYQFDLPSNLAFTPEASGTSAAVSWNAPASTGGSSISSYQVWITEVPDCYTVTIGGTPYTYCAPSLSIPSQSVSASTLQATFQGLTADHSYDVYLRAYNSAGLYETAELSGALDGPFPLINAVSFSGDIPSPTITVSGVDFGSAPPASSSVPSYCANSGSGNDYPNNGFFLQDLSRSPWAAGASGDCIGLVLSPSSYTNTNIVFSLGSYYGLGSSHDYTLHNGDGYELTLGGDTISGIVNSLAPTPTISSVTIGGTKTSPTITVSGSGFGAGAAVLGAGTPASTTGNCSPATGDDYGTNFYIDDTTGSWVAGLGPPNLAAVGVNISSYTNDQIAFVPGSCYGQNGWVFKPGDAYTMNVLGASYAGAVPTLASAAYVANSGSGDVSVINTSTNAVFDTVNVGSTPNGVAISGGFAYVANSGSNTVSVINTSTNAVASTVNVGSYPYGVAITPNGSYAYVTNAHSNTVSVINTSTNAVVSTVNVGTGPLGVAISPNGNFAYVANSGSNTVSVINTSTNAVASTVNVGSYPYGVAITPNGSYTYVTNVHSNTVSVINTSTNAVGSTVNVGSAPAGVAMTPSGSDAYVVNSGSNTVSVINTSTNAVGSTVNVGSAPYGIAITSNGSYAYVANSGSGNVSVINTSTNAVVNTVNVGSFPGLLAIA